MANICRIITNPVAPTKNLLEKGFIEKIDLVADLQFHALNHWKTASVVRDMVHALAISVSKKSLNMRSVPIIIGIDMMSILWAISVSMRFLDLLKLRSRRSLSFGSIAREIYKKPSVTKLSQMICAGRIGKGKPITKAPSIVSASPMLVENKNKITFLIVL